MRGTQPAGAEVAELRGQVEALRGQMEGIESVLHRLVEAQEFQAELLKPPPEA